jgi:hypothetical protein
MFANYITLCITSGITLVCCKVSKQDELLYKEESRMHGCVTLVNMCTECCVMWTILEMKPSDHQFSQVISLLPSC